MKKYLLAVSFFAALQSFSQICYTISNRTNGNGQSASCGTPNCSGNAKTGHIEINFGASCPIPMPTLVLTAVTSGALPNPFCFDPGSCQSPGIVRYCFRGTNLPSSGSMTLQLTSGATTWRCSYSVNGGGGIILPVQLSYFTAKVEQQSVLVRWRTEQEVNNDRFEIERSDNGTNFRTIATIKANGNSSLPVNYEYYDQSPYKGISLYRLKQVDIDGRSNYSSVQRTDNRIEGLHVKELFPNPARLSATLTFSTDYPTTLNIKIISASGQILKREAKKVTAGDHIWPIDVTKFSYGIYQIIITTEHGKIVTETLLVQ